MLIKCLCCKRLVRAFIFLVYRGGGYRISVVLIDAASTIELRRIDLVVMKMLVELTCLGILVLPARRGDIILGCARHTVRLGRSIKLSSVT
jgi:hypothetical protein